MDYYLLLFFFLKKPYFSCQNMVMFLSLIMQILVFGIEVGVGAIYEIIYIIYMRLFVFI